MIKQKEWVIMRNLYQQGMKKTAIARYLGINRKTVANNLKKPTTPKYHRKALASKLDNYKPYIKSQLEKYDITAQKLYQQIQKQGYNGKYVLLANFVKSEKKELKKKAVLRFETLPGEQAQVDWGYFGQFYDQREKRWIALNCFFMILGYSRTLYIEFFQRADLINFLKGHNHAFKYFGGYSREILYDNLKSVVIKRKLRAKDSEFNKKFMDFAGYYGFKPILCRPYKPNTKGKVENSVLYAKRNFFAGEEFISLKQLNRKASEWLEKINSRIHNTTKQRPKERLQREGLISVKDKRFYDTSTIKYRRVFNDCHFSYKANFYSVPYQYAGKEAAICEKETGKITVIYRNQVIAEHILNETDKGRYITSASHIEGLKALRMSQSLKKPKEAAKECSKSNNKLLTVSTILGKQEDAEPIEERDLALYEEVS